MGTRDWRKSYRWDEELSFDDALDLVRYILENGRVIYSTHLVERMNERSFTLQDVESVLESGIVVSQEFDKENRNWKYKIQGKTIENDEAMVVSAVIDTGRLLIVTIF